jgi:hypothetical protein
MSQQDQQPNPTHTQNTGLIYIVLAVLLIAAAFVAGRLLNTGDQTSGAGGVSEVIRPDGGVERRAAIQLEPAEELPLTPPEIFGLYARRTDNSIFVKEGDGRISVEVNDDNVVVQNAGGSNTEVEIVITGDTVVYKDVTQSSGEAPSADGVVQQQIAPGSADETGANSFVSAWGQRRGERIVADVLVYSDPVILGRP